MDLILDRVKKIFKNTIVVDDVSIRMQSGIYGILGSNGAGKTTLMRMICTVMKPTEGSIYYENKDIFEMDEKYRDILGYLPQEFGFYPELTVTAYLKYISSLKGLKQDVVKRRIDELLELTGMQKDSFKKMKELSGGMKRRVGIAQSLLNDPKILVLDEPTAGLDPKGRDELFDEIIELKKKRDMTVILVSHSMEDVAKYVDRLLVMNKGELVLDGTPKEVFKQYKFLESIGLSAPGITYIVERLKKEGVDLGDDITTIEEARDKILEYIKRKDKNA